MITLNLNDIFSCKTASVLYSWIASPAPLLLNSCEMKQIFNVCLRKQSANACPFRVKKSSVIMNDMISYVDRSEY